jgi:HNH endonuclease
MYWNNNLRCEIKGCKNSVEKSRKICSTHRTRYKRTGTYEPSQKAQHRNIPYIQNNGYFYITIKGHVHPMRYHVYLMEQKLGRKITKGEVVHHINGNITDNRIENLELITRATHVVYHNNLRGFMVKKKIEH